MRRNSDIRKATATIQEILRVPDCGIYWYPTLSEANRDRELLALDAHRVLLIGEVDTEKDFDSPTDMLVTVRGEIAPNKYTGVHMQGEKYQVVANGNNFSEPQLKRLRTAAQMIADWGSSYYYDEMIREGVTAWNIRRANVAHDFSFLGDRDRDLDALVHRERTKEGY